MNLTDICYRDFDLIREMFASVDLLSGFDFGCTSGIAESILAANKLLLTGEGSSRIFPAKNFIYQLRRGIFDGIESAVRNLNIMTEGCYQVIEYDLSDWSVVAASNSGQTREAVVLYSKLQNDNHKKHFAVTANPNAKLSELSNGTILLRCGQERAVAATKSVVEQAVVYLSILRNVNYITSKNLPEDADKKQRDEVDDDFLSGAKKAADIGLGVMEVEYERSMVDILANAATVYFAGRNNGVAEELALKTNEIVRKRSLFLEGTYLLHGVEEVMTLDDVVVLVDPFESEVKMIEELFVKKHKIPVIAISNKATPFHTVEIPACRGYDQFIQIFAGWNLLVQAGVRIGIDLDKPLRARKIGNHF
jgi:glucosamine--fructose-6-phosphate aminotransferase (isomerizing)